MKNETMLKKRKALKQIRNIAIITGILFIALYGLSFIRNNAVALTFYIISWIDFTTFLLSLIAFIILRGRYQDNLKEKEEKKVHSEKKVPVLMIFLILAVILDLIAIVLLAIINVANMCDEMGCIGYIGGLVLLLIVSVPSTIILSIRLIDRRKLSKKEPEIQREEDKEIQEEVR